MGRCDESCVFRSAYSGKVSGDRSCPDTQYGIRTTPSALAGGREAGRDGHRAALTENGQSHSGPWLQLPDGVAQFFTVVDPLSVHEGHDIPRAKAGAVGGAV